MGLMNLFRGELIEIIEWIDDSRDTLAWRFPDDDKAIKNGAQLIVRESQVAQLVMTGQFADTFWPGKHTLSTPNVPVLARIQGWQRVRQGPARTSLNCHHDRRARVEVRSVRGCRRTSDMGPTPVGSALFSVSRI